MERESHPARYPSELPAFFIKFLTDPGDLVVDIFAGSNTTGRVAADLGRRWIAMEERRDYASLSALRFLEACPLDEVRARVTRMEKGGTEDLSEVFLRRIPQLDLFGATAT